MNHPGSRITIYYLPQCFTVAYHRAFTFENTTAGFRKTGIYPLNSEIFPEYEFAAANVLLPKRYKMSHLPQLLTQHLEHLQIQSLQMILVLLI